MSHLKNFEDWYLDYKHDVYKYILSFVKNRHSAEDLMQETFIKAYVKADTFKGASNVRTWLFSIAYHVTMDYFKKQMSINQMVFKYKSVMMSQETSSDIKKRENKKELLASIRKLKNSYRQVLIFRKLQGYSVKETAKVLHWSESKVKVTLSRALRSLRKQLIIDGNYMEIL